MKFRAFFFFGFRSVAVWCFLSSKIALCH